MVDIQIASQSPRRAVVRAVPLPACSCAASVLYHARTITLQHHLPGVAGAILGNPVREEGAAIACLRALGCDLEGGELGLGGACRRDVGGRGEGEWEGESVGEERGDEKGREKRVHT